MNHLGLILQRRGISRAYTYTYAHQRARIETSAGDPRSLNLEFVRNIYTASTTIRGTVRRGDQLDEIMVAVVTLVLRFR